jgi:hypothetical protein
MNQGTGITRKNAAGWLRLTVNASVTPEAERGSPTSAHVFKSTDI